MIVIKSKVFLQIEPKIRVLPGQSVNVKDIASIFCEDKEKEERIKDVKVYRVSDNLKSEVLSVIEVIDSIHKSVDNVDIVILGNSEILLNINVDKSENTIFNIIKVIIVSIILFLGSALAIIYFHEDVGMENALRNIYNIITGIESDRPLILFIPYSIGIGIGMATFFNHVLKKKWKKEPSPLEVEMYLYDKSIDDYVLDMSKHNKKSK